MRNIKSTIKEWLDHVDKDLNSPEFEALLDSLDAELEACRPQPITSCPYDEIVLFKRVDGNWFQGFIYDGPAPKDVTEWMQTP